MAQARTPSPTRSAGPRAQGTDPFQGDRILTSEATYEGLVLDGQDFSDQAGTLVTFSRSTLLRVALARTKLSRLDLTDVRMEACDAANAVWEKAHIGWSRLDGCRMVGLDLSGALIRNAVISGCNVSFAQFRAATFKTVHFHECNLRGCSFQEADLRGTVFQGCDLTEAQMSFTKLEGTDFRGSEIQGLKVRIEDLKGAIVEPAQAAYLSGLMGLRVIH